MLKNKDIFSISPEELTPEQREELKAQIIASVRRLRKSRGEAAEADAKARKPKNLDLDAPINVNNK